MRREFSRSVKVAIVKRATRNGTAFCELCHGSAAAFEIHHIDQDAMQVEKAGVLTEADGVLLCKPCHKLASAAQAPVLAKVKRIEERHLGLKKPKARIPRRPKGPRSTAKQDQIAKLRMGES
jgi:hypothetical protein